MHTSSIFFSVFESFPATIFFTAFVKYFTLIVRVIIFQKAKHQYCILGIVYQKKDLWSAAFARVLTLQIVFAKKNK